MIARVLEPEAMDTQEEADGYDAMDHSAANAAFAKRMQELGAHGRVLDIGCGPGHIPLLLCEALPQARIVGVDLAAHMLRHAEASNLSASKYAGVAVDFLLDLEEAFGGPLTEQFRRMLVGSANKAQVALKKLLA